MPRYDGVNRKVRQIKEAVKLHYLTTIGDIHHD